MPQNNQAEIVWWLLNRLPNLFLLFVILMGNNHPVFANFELNSLKNVAIFPPKGIQNTEISNEVWWQTRELLAQDGRFLIATRRLMINRQTLNPKDELKPPETIILGKILEAQLLVTLFVKENICYFHAYRTYDGIPVFLDSLAMSYALTEEEQLLIIFKALTQRFLQSIPYAGYQTISPKSQQFIEYHGSRPIVYAEISQAISTKNLLGKDIYWLDMRYPSFPLFQQTNPTTRIWAIGRVIEELPNNHLQIELTQYSDLKMFEKENLVFIPVENKMHEPIFHRESQLSHEFLLESSKSEKNVTQQKIEATFLGFLFTLGSLILMIF
ncbi:MAG: hypothetical protein NZ480_08385 [Bdellovibrionaceae bacterium]|nr:hypothetical protein [Pseudobdellovibrionaceae bacterium]MDW8190354.1 hypothetical protein [Pseudobdellovibrionaceae bacterium]